MLTEQSKDASLIAVGGHDYGQMKSVLLGSATLHVLHQAVCPVMVVPESAGRGGYARIVIALDDGGDPISTLRWGLDAARRHGCPARVVEVQRRNPAQPSAFTIALYSDHSVQWHVWLEKQLSAVGEAVDGISVTSAVLEGSASAAILVQAGMDDLLVLGSRGRGGFVGLLLGSVASQCAQHAEGVVVVVKPASNGLGMPPGDDCGRAGTGPSERKAVIVLRPALSRHRWRSHSYPITPSTGATIALLPVRGA